MKKLTAEEIRGQRIKALRIKTKLSRTEFCRRYGIPLPTVKAWEYGDVKTMHGSGINAFVNGLMKEGVPCTLDYILNGERLSTTHAVPINFADEIKSFHQIYNTAVDHIIEDDSMAPYLQKNCLVLGVPSDLDDSYKYLNHVCIIKLKTGRTKVRVVTAARQKNSLILTSANKDSENIERVQIDDLTFIAPIVKSIRQAQY